MIRPRALKSVLVAVLLVVTSATAGAARGQVMAAGEVVICSGGQVLTLRLDAEGNPVGPGHVCPDCVLSLVAAPPAGATGAHRAADWRLEVFDPAHAVRSALAARPLPNARAPPACRVTDCRYRILPEQGQHP